MDGRRLQEAGTLLVEAGIAGPHQSHTRRNALAKITTLVDGESDDTFGLSGTNAYSASEVLGFVSDLTGCNPDITSVEGFDVISMDKTIEGLVSAGQRLGAEAGRGATLLAATGHPTGMLETYRQIDGSFNRAGGKVLRPREGDDLGIGRRPLEVRYIGGVGCLADWGALRHTHSAAPMEALLADATPDIVLGDHGFAGAALERRIPAVAIMDINDPALAIAWAEGKDVTIVPLDDNRFPGSYEPAWQIVTAMIEQGNQV
jgi:hypothetical protein